MNKEKLLEEFDKRQKALRDEFIAKLEDDKKEFKLTYPRTDETVYFIYGNSMNIGRTFFWDTKLEYRYTFEHGLYFRTKEEAEHYLKERKLLFKLHQYAKEKNEGWEPDWSDNDERKFFIYHDRSSGDKELKKDWCLSSDDFSKLPYFKTYLIAQECIELFGDEIKEVLL